jgi:hypothetical protein
MALGAKGLITVFMTLRCSLMSYTDLNIPGTTESSYLPLVINKCTTALIP